MKKILRFDKLIDYNNFLIDINQKSFDEINNMSSVLDDSIIVEGLIKTYQLDKSVDILKRKFPDCELNIDDNCIYIYGKMNYGNLKNLSNTLGYYISLLTQNDKEISEENLDQNEDYLASIEPKYDFKVTEKPRILYHVTFNKYLKRIFEFGLIPKSQNKLSKHTDRIHLFTDIDDAILFSKYLENTYNNPTSILEIDTTELNNSFFSDINFRRSGIYTINNISPDHIRIKK